MSGDFLDSNVVLYGFQVHDPRQPRAKEIIAACMDGAGHISFQVVQEVLNVLSRRPDLYDPLDLQETLENVLTPLWRVQPSYALYGHAIAVHRRYAYSFYDSLIIAAALESGCDRLLSEDMQHGQRIDGLTIENPFRGV
jgi:predicted nucleic acid-binding protein